ncbi:MULTISPECIES: hypothetical protein [unclassified Nitrobacter]|uniref:hypothetical protein n=1 Tax=unclassified Nitrobacter TaxID=2620411 RepID=UPI001AC1BCFA|nr:MULTISPECIES: hypothetical protein [unclassified Nitrobacter]MBN9147176.1 hypothetical protein [Nitrobacter sp.]
MRTLMNIALFLALCGGISLIGYEHSKPPKTNGEVWAAQCAVTYTSAQDRKDCVTMKALYEAMKANEKNYQKRLDEASQ